MKLTDKQREVLSFIQSFIQEKHIPPTVRDICEGLNMKSTGNIHRHLSNLQDKGAIEWEEFRQRTIRVVKGVEGMGGTPVLDPHRRICRGCVRSADRVGNVLNCIVPNELPSETGAEQ